MAATRLVRQKALLDTLYQVEAAQIPFPDDQPIVYPPADLWQEMTMRRKHWKEHASVDLNDTDGNTAKIRKALDEKTKIDFTDQPLQDVITYLHDLHGIEIQLDSESVGRRQHRPRYAGHPQPARDHAPFGRCDSMLARTRILTYIIKNEVLLITTPDKAANELNTKVYPVADLVMPIPQIRMGGGMMGGGMGGMMGGGGGGMGGGGMGGGGMGGGGMGGGGMGGGGMGGGMF